MARLNAAWFNFTKRGQAWDHFWQDAAAAGGTTQFASLSGTLAFVGGLSKYSRVNRGGTLAFSGAVLKKTSVLRSGTLAFSGALAGAIMHVKALAGVLAFTGTLAKYTRAIRNGSLVLTGDLLKKTSASRGGTLAFSGAVSRKVSYIRAFSGALSFVGEVLKKTTISNGGTLAFSATLGKLTRVLRSGTVSFSGGLEGVAPSEEAVIPMRSYFNVESIGWSDFSTFINAMKSMNCFSDRDKAKLTEICSRMSSTQQLKRRDRNNFEMLLAKMFYGGIARRIP